MQTVYNQSYSRSYTSVSGQDFRCETEHTSRNSTDDTMFQENIMLKKKIEELVSEYNKTVNKLRIAESETQSYKRWFNETSIKNANLRQRVCELEDEVEKTKRGSRLGLYLLERQKLLRDLDEKDKIIEKLRTKDSDKNATIKKLSRMCKSKDKTIEKLLEEKQYDKDLIIDYLTQDCEDKDKTIKSLQSRFTKIENKHSKEFDEYKQALDRDYTEKKKQLADRYHTKYKRLMTTEPGKYIKEEIEKGSLVKAADYSDYLEYKKILRKMGLESWSQCRLSDDCEPVCTCVIEDDMDFIYNEMTCLV